MGIIAIIFLLGSLLLIAFNSHVAYSAWSKNRKGEPYNVSMIFVVPEIFGLLYIMSAGLNGPLSAIHFMIMICIFIFDPSVWALVKAYFLEKES